MDNPIKILRQLKGAPLSVLLACFIAKQRVTEKWLCSMSGYSDKTVSSALLLLNEYGWVVHAQGGWVIANAEQLPLMLNLLEGDTESRRNSALSSSSNLDLININDSTTTNQRKNSDFSANLVVLLTGGIKEPKASTLADLEHVTPEYIQAHLQQVRREERNVATAIYRIENNWEKPEIKEIIPPPVDKYTNNSFAEVMDRGKGEYTQ